MLLSRNQQPPHRQMSSESNVATSPAAVWQSKSSTIAQQTQFGKLYFPTKYGMHATNDIHV